MKSALHTNQSSVVKKPAVKYRGRLPRVERKIFSFYSKYDPEIIREAFIIAEKRYAFVLSGNYSRN